MKIVTYKVYDFNELSGEARQAAIEKWYKNEEYPFLAEDLTDLCGTLLSEKKITHDELKLYYNLSNCQGDGLCFIGKFQWKKYYISITHNYRYYYAESTEIMLMNEKGNEVYNEKAIKQFTDIYLNICGKLEKEGYGILEYRMNFDEMRDFCETNNYTFTANGIMDNQIQKGRDEKN